MTQTQKIGGVVAVVALAIVGWWATQDSPPPPKKAEAPKAAPAPEPAPAPAPKPKAPEIRVIETCEAARDYLNSQFEGELPEHPLALAQLSWDAGLTWAPGPVAETTPGGFHAVPQRSVSVGEMKLTVSKASSRLSDGKPVKPIS